MFDDIKAFIVTNSLRLISTLIVIFVTFVLILIVRFFTKRFLKKSKNRRALTVAKLVQSIFKYILVITAFIIIIAIWGVNVTGLLAGAGLLGLIIGLGAQSMIQDLLSGVSIVFEDYYEVDEVVEIKGFKGRVVEIGLRATKIMNFKGELKIISNGDIKDITNYSRHYSLALVVIAIEYKENIDHVIALLQEKLSSMLELFPQIIEGPNVLGVSELANSSVNITITAKTLPEQHYAVERGLRKYIKELFDENNITIPFPQVVLHDER